MLHNWSAGHFSSFSVCGCGVCFGLFCLRLFWFGCVFWFFWFVTELWRHFGLCIGPPPVIFWGHSISRRPSMRQLINSLISATCNRTCWTTWRKPRGVGRKKNWKTLKYVSEELLLHLQCRRCCRVSCFVGVFSILCLACEAKRFHTFCTLLYRLSHPSHRARSAATEEKKPLLHLQVCQKCRFFLEWWGAVYISGMQWIALHWDKRFRSDLSSKEDLKIYIILLRVDGRQHWMDATYCVVEISLDIIFGCFFYE